MTRRLALTLFALALSTAAGAQTYRPGGGFGMGGRAGFQFLSAPQAATSALKWATAGTGWALSNNSLTATRDTTATGSATFVTSNLSRSAGPAAVQFTINTGPGAPGSAAIGFSPSGSNTGPGDLFWYASGLVTRDGGTQVYAAASATSWGSGNVLTLRLSDAATLITLIRDGVQVGTVSVGAVARTPSAASGATAWSTTISGAPSGETAW